MREPFSIYNNLISSLVNRLFKNMDMEADPCQDFNQFACGGFIKVGSISTLKHLQNKMFENHTYAKFWPEIIPNYSWLLIAEPSCTRRQGQAICLYPCFRKGVFEDKGPDGGRHHR